MNVAGQTICLSMIVRNEAPVIRRCLDSVRPIIDRWMIVDTGSTDGTQDIIREYLRDLPGELEERPWRDFAHNRSEALGLARARADYALIIDADDALEIASGTILPPLVADSYTIDISDASIVYQRTQVVRCAMPWRYEGVLHEYLACDGAGPPGQLPGIRMRRNHDGARRRDPRTFRRDAAVLELALATEADPFLIARYRLYLAQSYRDCGEWERALSNYQARAELGFWQEEVFISLYQVAQLKERLGRPDREVIDAYLQAADSLSTRAEALHRASRFCREKGHYADGYRLAKRGLEIPMPASSALFVEPSVYETGLLDEFALNAYWSGHHRESLEASVKALGSGKLPEADVQRVAANALAASKHLAGDPNLGSRAGEGLVEQHALGMPRRLHSRLPVTPRVLVAIHVDREAELLPAYLQCIESLDYPKDSIVLYIRGWDDDEATRLLRQWTDRVEGIYAAIEFEIGPPPVEPQTPSRIPGHIRQFGLRRTLDHKCGFYFVADLGSLVRPCMLRELVALDLPIVAPFLRSVTPEKLYSNYHAEIDRNGYYKECDQYFWMLNRWVRGVLEVPVVNSAYLVRADLIDFLTYDDGTSRDAYVVFSDSARNSSIPQYLDNRQVYGYCSAGDRFDSAGKRTAKTTQSGAQK